MTVCSRYARWASEGGKGRPRDGGGRHDRGLPACGGKAREVSETAFDRHEGKTGGTADGEIADIFEKLDFRPTCHYSARGLPRGEADDVTVVAPQDVTYRSRVNVMPQMHQGTLDAAVPPGGILFSHADHERFDLLRHTRSFKWSSETPPNHSLGATKAA
jgi:hypothetical protein